MQTRRPRGAWLRTVLIVLVVLVIVVTTGMWVLNRTGRSRLQQTVNDLNAAGQVLTFGELEARRPQIPDDENGALVLLETMPRIVAAKRSESSRENPVPCFGRGKLPAWDEPWPDETLRDVAEFLNRNQELLDTLDKLQETRSGRFPLELDMQPPHSPDFTQYTPVRAACKLILLRAMFEAQSGRSDKAVEHCITALHASTTLSTEPLLLTTLIISASDSLVCIAVEHLLAAQTLSDPSLVKLAGELAEHEQTNALVWALRGELAWTMQAYESSLGGLLGALGSVVWFARDTTKTLELLTRLLRAAESRADLLKEATAVQKEANSLSRLYITTKIRMPAVCRAPTLWERRTAMLRCTIAALAAERFRTKSGRWPNSLEELAPDYLDEVPVDPFSGQPLRYKLGNELLTIYSVGENGVDDAGDVDWTGRWAPDVGFRLLTPQERVSRRHRGSE